MFKIVRVKLNFNKLYIILLVLNKQLCFFLTNTWSLIKQIIVYYYQQETSEIRFKRLLD